MDRYALAREFELVKMLDNIQLITDPRELKEVALGLAKLNYGLREYIAQSIEAEIPKTIKWLKPR